MQNRIFSEVFIKSKSSNCRIGFMRNLNLNSKFIVIIYFIYREKKNWNFFLFVSLGCNNFYHLPSNFVTFIKPINIFVIK